VESLVVGSMAKFKKVTSFTDSLVYMVSKGKEELLIRGPDTPSISAQIVLKAPRKTRKKDSVSDVKGAHGFRSPIPITMI
jgi:hypothetical protein